MKQISALIFAVLVALAAVISGRAQAAESIWLAASPAAYRAGDTVIVTVNAQSATQVQGFTFQIRYDPACLKPEHAASPIAGMNGLPLPQATGLVDASFASTVPQTVNGILAEVRFLSLTSCQTNVALESAALAVRNQDGYAAPLKGISTGNSSIALSIGPGPGAPQPTPPLIGTPLPLGVQASGSPNLWLWGVLLLLVMLLVGAGLVGLLRWSSRGSSTS